MKSVEQKNLAKTSTKEALTIFDALPPVETTFMLGDWKGEGFHTGHPMDGLLETYHWHGKRFENSEDVHPLVLNTVSGAKAFLNPTFMRPFLGVMGDKALPKAPVLAKAFQLAMPLFTTFRSKARLRMTTYRGISSATMSYDQLPINDVFRKIDDNSVFGLMDLKGMKKPFFFILHRERK